MCRSDLLTSNWKINIQISSGYTLVSQLQSVTTMKCNNPFQEDRGRAVNPINSSKVTWPLSSKDSYTHTNTHLHTCTWCGHIQHTLYSVLFCFLLKWIERLFKKKKKEKENSSRWKALIYVLNASFSFLQSSSLSQEAALKSLLEDRVSPRTTWRLCLRVLPHRQLTPESPPNDWRSASHAQFVLTTEKY